MNEPLTPLRRLRASGLAPARSLGQNFLVDPNILDVIERAAALGADDTILEVGPGLGVLTGRLLDRCRLVHSLEVDPRLAALLAEEFGARPGFRLHRGDAMRLNLSQLDPPPGKFVSNLPYNVAVPLVMKSIAELDSLTTWCLMLQKEIADRLFAPTGSPGYGAASVLTRLAARKLSSRPVSASVFYPRPRVRSTLLAFERRAGGLPAGAEFAGVRELARASFSHRRKMLVNSLSEAEPPPEPLKELSREAVRILAARLLRRLGLPAGVRPQAVTPRQYRLLAGMIAGAGSSYPGGGDGHA